MSEAPAGLEAALASSLGALLADEDAYTLQVVAGAKVVVIRRGRRELLDVDTDELETALLEAGLEEGPLSLTLASGAALQAATLADGRWALAVTRQRPRPSTVADAIEAGLLPAAEASRLMEAVLAGRSVLVAGPCRWGAQTLAAALAQQAAEAMSGMALADEAVGALPPAPAGNTVERTRLSAALGAAFVFADDLTQEAIEALEGEDVVVVAATRCAPSKLAAGAGWHVVTVGFAPDGAPELKTAAAEAAPPPETIAPVLVAAPAAAARRPVAALTPAPAALRQPAAAPLVEEGDLEELPPLKPLPPGPPTDWATPDDQGPGWELDDDGLPPAFDSFPGELGAEEDRAGGGAAFASLLKGAGEGTDKPAFTPRPPVEHPQTRQLKTDPLGGMTLEPPGSNPRGDE